jgi:hypothetical protein
MTLRVSDRHYLILQQTQREKTAFTVAFAIIFGRDREARKDLLGISEIDAMLAEVESALFLIP